VSLIELIDGREMPEARYNGLVRLICAVRNVRGYNEMNPGQLEKAVLDWDDVLSAVPHTRLNELRVLGLQRGASDASQFFQIFDKELDRRVVSMSYADFERMKRDRELREQAQNGELDRGQGRRAYLLQQQRYHAGLLAVSCECNNDYGLATTAILSGDGQRWICANNTCGFEWPASETMTAPSRGAFGPLRERGVAR